jgi:hypothetical protein
MNQLLKLLRRGAPLGGVLVVSAAWDTLNEEDLRCEELMAELADCCPDFDPTVINCQYEGCNPATFSVSELSCLEEMSCREIHARDLCARLDGRSPSTGTTTTEEDDLCE